MRTNIPKNANVYVIAATFLEYDQVVNVLRLDPGRCFHCLSVQEAVESAGAAHQRGVPVAFAAHQDLMQNQTGNMGDWQHIGDVLVRVVSEWVWE